MKCEKCGKKTNSLWIIPGYGWICWKCKERIRKDNV